MKRHKHSLSHYKLLSMNMGDLVPIGLYLANPGDTIQQATSALVRVSPLLAPVMHPVHVRIHHWFVPLRLIWDDFEDFITGGPDGMDASVFPTVAITSGNPAVGSLADYLGIPPNSGFNTTVSALPFRAYALTWNEFYRDQDLQTELAISTASGTDATTSQVLQQVCWEKDYFTSARPWTSKGAEVYIPADTSSVVTRVSGANSAYYYKGGSDTPAADGANSFFGNPNTTLYDGVNGTSMDPRGGLITPIATAMGTINELKEAFAIMRYQEARAQYGSRYTEYLRYLGVRSSDARLQRPEYLGGGKQTIQFSEVLQTSNTTDGDDSEGVGNLKGHGIGALRSNRYRRFFEEHGFVLSFMSVRPKTIYGQGIDRHWLYSTKEDFYQKELENVGQQALAMRELYFNNSTDPWGYQNRYDEYRQIPSKIAGEFRTTLAHWHMARIFGSAPTLNSDFVKANPTDRIYASTSTDQLYVMANHSIQARRMVSARGGVKLF